MAGTKRTGRCCVLPRNHFGCMVRLVFSRYLLVYCRGAAIDCDDLPGNIVFLLSSGNLHVIGNHGWFWITKISPDGVIHQEEQKQPRSPTKAVVLSNRSEVVSESNRQRPAWSLVLPKCGAHRQ